MWKKLFAVVVHHFSLIRRWETVEKHQSFPHLETGTLIQCHLLRCICHNHQFPKHLKRLWMCKVILIGWLVSWNIRIMYFELSVCSYCETYFLFYNFLNTPQKSNITFSSLWGNVLNSLWETRKATMSARV